MGSHTVSAAQRNAQLGRILDVLRALDRRDGVDLYELAEQQGTTVRTIRRDLDALRGAGLPLSEETDGKRKRWRLSVKDRLGELSGLLDASHYLALRVAMGQGSALHNASSLFATLEDLAQKIETAVGKPGRAQLSAIEACFYSYEKFAYQKAPPDVLWVLVQAITERRVCEVRYRTPGSSAAKAFNVLPLRLFVHQGAVYLMCHVPKHSAVATLNLQRLEDLRVLDVRAEAPKDFDPQRLENAAFGVFSGGPETTYVLRFDAEVAPFIHERTWHPTQRLRALRGGGVEVKFTCRGSHEVSAWVASWRDHATVVEPKGLREELGELGEWLSEKYRAKKPAQPSASAKRPRRTVTAAPRTSTR